MIIRTFKLKIQILKKDNTKNKIIQTIPHSKMKIQFTHHHETVSFLDNKKITQVLHITSQEKAVHRQVLIK